MPPRSREEIARRLLARCALIAGCALLPAALSVWSVERRPGPFPTALVAKGVGALATLRDVEVPLVAFAPPKPLAADEHYVEVTFDRYTIGFPYPWWSEFAYLAWWSYPPPFENAPLPDAAKIDEAVSELLLPWVVTREIDPWSVVPKAGHDRPIYGQRVLGGFDTVGALADVSLAVLGVVTLGCLVSIYTLVRRRVIDATRVYVENLGLTVEQRRRRVVERGECPNCGYEVDYPAQARCPECGLDLAETVRAGEG